MLLNVTVLLLGLAEGCYNLGNEPSDSMKGDEFLTILKHKRENSLIISVSVWSWYAFPYSVLRSKLPLA
jgi:hypothetical protein